MSQSIQRRESSSGESTGPAEANTKNTIARMTQSTRTKVQIVIHFVATYCVFLVMLTDGPRRALKNEDSTTCLSCERLRSAFQAEKSNYFYKFSGCLFY